MNINDLKHLSNNNFKVFVEEDKDIVYNEGQKNALNGLVTWALDKSKERDSYFVTLKGGAGTGKSFTTNQIIKELKKNKIWGITVTAPTHKAKKIIGKFTGEEASTIQALLGLKPNTDLEDFNPNSPQFAQEGEILMRYTKLLIVDEASMLNKELYKMICNCAYQYKTKVLFIGDDRQINPVNEDISPVFTDVKLSFELTEIVRQKDTNPIAELLVILRDDIENDTTKYMQYLKDNPKQINDKGEGYELYTDHVTFLDYYMEHLATDDYKIDPDYVKYTAWTNDSIKGFNTMVRKRVYGDGNTAPFKDEILMGYNSVRIGKTQVVTNSEDYLVQGIKPIVNTYVINGYQVDLQSVSGLSERVFIVGKEGYPEFIRQHDEYLIKAKKQGKYAWVEYYKFKNQNLLIENLFYSNKTLACKKDLDYAYGVSTHKTQGSTYNTIFVNGGNINKNNNRVEKLRLWYVALSRCSKKAVILL